MFHYDYKTENICSQIISLDLDGNVVHNVSFMGGCNGNLKAIPIPIEGWTAEQIEETLTGILCGRRPTSCADQLAKVVRAAYEAEKRHEIQNKTFHEELSRLRTDHIDYYLMHMVTDHAEWEHLKALGIKDWIERQKAEGRSPETTSAHVPGPEVRLPCLP